MIDNDWRDRAHCRNTDPNMMQPESATPDQLGEAMELCEFCPVRDACRALAVSQGDGAYGIHDGEWFGDPPHNPALLACRWCGADMVPARYGTRRMYCSDAHRKAAKRAREAVSA